MVRFGGWPVVSGAMQVLFGSAAPLSAVAAPDIIYKIDSGSTIVTDPCTVTAKGGTGSYAYSCSHVSGDALVVVDSPSSAITTFSTTSIGSGVSRQAIKKCVVSDGSVTIDTNTIEVTIERL